MKNETKSLTFHSEDVVSRITLWANIVAYIILAFSMIGFIYSTYSIVTNWSQVVASLPPSLFERTAIFISQIFMDPMVGVFYFLVLRGLAQLLNLGRDLYYRDFDEVEDESDD